MTKSLLPVLFVVSLSLLIWAPVNEGRSLDEVKFMQVNDLPIYFPAGLINLKDPLSRGFCAEGKCQDPNTGTDCKEMECCYTVACVPDPFGKCHFQTLECGCDKCGVSN